MLWIKTIHILFMMSWMAGIFYLPRIFVHFVEGKEAGQDVSRLAIMALKLYKFMTIMMWLTLASGLWLWLAYFPIAEGMGWLHVKLLFVLLLIAYHYWARARMLEMQQGQLDHSGVYYRWANEIPLLFATVILIMVVVKPI
ncbi:CopD family protein [Thiomicrorhabdus sediminis]|uniref:Protoporphyrinogen IX oxidase n=1 Tax=Thiomicrorhabdus sediminis TaxID=2580412 RepID=A0A4P9K755_9GAMM|nr:CopD family protein [Thiomicrorhabdus sediminis]QCU90077.1 CopD family protein [Thiomicrorhabdus sediminis]